MFWLELIVVLGMLLVGARLGGMDYLIQVAIRMLRSNSKRISIYAPLIS